MCDIRGTVTVKCTICDKEFEGRKDAKYCSAGCRKKASRTTIALGTTLDIADLPVVSVPTMMTLEQPPQTPKMTISEGDFVYGSADDPNKTWDRGCVVCGHKFETPLELMRFCSGECRQNVMIALANGPHKGYKH